MKKFKKRLEKFFHNIPEIYKLLALALLVRILLSPFGTLKLDQGTFIAWSKKLYEGGFNNFYNFWSDYLPGYLYILSFLGRFADSSFNGIIFKIPAILADIVTGFLIYKIVKDKLKKKAFLPTTLFLFNPAVIANSTLWGQVDIFTSLLSLLPIYFLDNFFLSSMFLAFGVLFKPQVVFAGVVIFVIAVMSKDIKYLVKYALSFSLVFILGFVPFNNSNNIFKFIFERIGQTTGQYPYSSINAFNFWGLFGFWKQDSIYLFLIGLLVVIGSLFLAIKYLKGKTKSEVGRYVLLAVIFLAGFLFGTRLHERHLLAIFAPLAILVSYNKYFLIPYVSLSLTYVLNLLYSYVWISKDFTSIYPRPLIILFIIMNLASFFLFFLILKKPEIFKKIKFSFSKTKGKAFDKKITIKKEKLRWIF